MGAIETIKEDAAPEPLVEDKIEESIRTLITSNAGEVDPAQLRRSMKTCEFSSQIADYSTLIAAYCADDIDRLEASASLHYLSDNSSFANNVQIERILPLAIDITMK